jgi:hypothetical protein
VPEEPTHRAISKRTRVLLLQRDGYRCRFCGTTAAEARLHVDHVMPRTRGGTDTLDNLATLCEDCNTGKSDLWLGNYAALVMKGTVHQPPVRQPISPPLAYTRDALLQILAHLVASGIDELSVAAFAHAIEVTTRDGLNELFEPLAFPTLLPAIQGAIQASVLAINGDMVQLLGQPKPHVLARRSSGSVDPFPSAPILRWQSPTARVEKVANDYRIAVDVHCSNEGPRESNARVQAFDAQLLRWGHLEFEDFQRGTTIYSVHGGIANRFLLKIRQPTAGAITYGQHTVSWTVVYTDDALRPFLTQASIEIDINGVGPARIVGQALDETTAEQRFDRYRQAAPDRLTGWSTGLNS